mmetsp:Transcript_12051/g.17303  ORF Transcript_12051/g.17303 Transcript_12051/m.17303 type:complete len:95 (+) Transcript_12051:392-676(+)
MTRLLQYRPRLIQVMEIFDASDGKRMSLSAKMDNVTLQHFRAYGERMSLSAKTLPTFRILTQTQVISIVLYTTCAAQRLALQHSFAVGYMVCRS